MLRQGIVLAQVVESTQLYGEGLGLSHVCVVVCLFNYVFFYKYILNAKVRLNMVCMCELNVNYMIA